MKVFMLFTGSGPVVILTSYASLTDPGLLRALATKGFPKFVAFEVPVRLAEQRYGAHFFVAKHDLRDADDLRILDENGPRAFGLFRLDELAGPDIHE